MRAWLFQDHRQRRKLGDKCPWSVGWLDPDGKRRSKRIGSKSMAEKFQRKIEGELAAGTYQSDSRKLWSQFIAHFEARVQNAMSGPTSEATKYALNHFTRIIRPQRIRSITSATIADFVAKRRVEPRCKQEGAACVSPATVNKELRTLRAVLRKAVKWGYLAVMPEIQFLREPGKLPTYVIPEHFSVIYDKGCEAARWPSQHRYTPCEWWRGLLITAYMTGWRIGSLMALRWADVDLEKAQALSRAADNKGKRDQLVPLHPVIVDHLRLLRGFEPLVFSWDHSRRSLFSEFKRLQKAAGLVLAGERPHYGFHDLRRAFATLNAGDLTPDVLQALMQHRSYETTQRYINMARQLAPALQKLFVPDVKIANRSLSVH